jgi:CheY-like chemotaxis protein
MNNAPPPLTILLADDDPDDRLMVREAFEENHLLKPLHTVEDGEELMDYLYRRGKFAGVAVRPNLILLDLNMPRKNGIEALQEIKSDPVLKNDSGRRFDDFKSRRRHFADIRFGRQLVYRQTRNLRFAGRISQRTRKILVSTRRTAQLLKFMSEIQNIPIKVLLVDDDEDDYILTRYVFDEFKANRYELDWVDSYDKGLAAMLAHSHDIYLVDYRLGAENGLKLLRAAKAEKLPRSDNFADRTGRRGD